MTTSDSSITWKVVAIGTTTLLIAMLGWNFRAATKTIDANVLAVGRLIESQIRNEAIHARLEDRIVDIEENMR